MTRFQMDNQTAVPADVERSPTMTMPAVLRLSADRSTLSQHADALKEIGFTESRSSASSTFGRDHATWNLTVSNADGDSVPQQAHDSFVFLRENWPDLHAVLFEIEDRKLTLDVSWDFPIQSIGQVNEFSADLIAILSNFDISLTVSVYSTAQTASD